MKAFLENKRARGLRGGTASMRPRKPRDLIQKRWAKRVL